MHNNQQELGANTGLKHDSTLALDFDICRDREIVQKVRSNPAYAQNLYAALCNTEWQYQDVWVMLNDKTWCCSWRYAGGVVADIRGHGDYMDYYCSGSMFWHEEDVTDEELARTKDFVPEGMVTEEIQQDLKKLGWVRVDCT